MRTVVRNSYTPQTGDYCNKIVIDEDKSVQYIFDSDGVFFCLHFEATGRRPDVLRRQHSQCR